MRGLKAAISGYLRRVAQGEHIRVTVRGRPIAELRSAGRRTDEDRWRELVAQGRITPAQGPWPRRAPRPQRVAGSASAHILAEREADRSVST